MNIDKIKKDINSLVGKDVLVSVNVGRNKREKYYGKVLEVYPYLFTIKVKDIIKSYTYNDILIASVLLDDEFAVHDIRIIEGTKGLFIAMPSRKTSVGNYRDIAHPISQEVRSMFEKAILDAYEKAGDSNEQPSETEEE